MKPYFFKIYKLSKPWKNRWGTTYYEEAWSWLWENDLHTEPTWEYETLEEAQKAADKGHYPI